MTENPYLDGGQQYGHVPEPAGPLEPVAKPGKEKKRFGKGVLIGVTAGALLFGCAVGGAAGASTAGEAGTVKTETVEVEKIVEVEVPGETVTETVEVEKVVEVPSKTCQDAVVKANDLIDHFGTAVGIAADVMGASGEAIMAAVEWDLAGMEKFTAFVEGKTAEVDKLTGKIESSPYWDAAAKCLAEGK